MSHNTTDTKRQRLNKVETESLLPQKVRQPAATQIGRIAPLSHMPPQVLQKLVGRAPNRALQSLVGASGGPVPDQAEQIIQREVGHGQPLESTTQAQMGNALGTNLSGVRVHHDDTSDQLAGELGARAFAVGSDVFFATNEYQPATTDGQRAIAHELAHVLQDSSQPQAKLRVGAEDDPAEVEADTVAQRVVETISNPASIMEEGETAQELRRSADEEDEEEQTVKALRREPRNEGVHALRRMANPDE